MACIIRSAVLATEPRSLYGAAAGIVPALDSVPLPDESATCTTAETARVQALEHYVSGLETKLSQLQLELDRWRDDEAERIAQALQDAAACGYADGQSRAESEASASLHQLTDQLNMVLASLKTQQIQRAHECEDVLVTIAFEAVCKLLGEAAASPGGIRQLVRQAIDELSDKDDLRIRVHPDDAALLKDALADQPNSLELVPDNAIRIGGCMIDSANGTLDARLETQLAKLAAVLSDTRKARDAQAGMAT